MRFAVNQSVENPKLSALLKELNDTKQSALMKSIAEALVTASLLVVVNVDDNDLEYREDGTATLRKGSHISFEKSVQPDGTNYLLVYTDWNELKKDEEHRDADVKTLIVSYDNMVAYTAGKDGIMINPFGDTLAIPPTVVPYMKPHKENIKDTEVLIREPVDYPAEMVEALKRYAKKNKVIQAMWLKLMVKDHAPSYC